MEHPAGLARMLAEEPAGIGSQHGQVPFHPLPIKGGDRGELGQALALSQQDGFPRLLGSQGGDERRQRLPLRDRLDEALLLGVDQGELALEGGPPVALGLVSLTQVREGTLDGGGDQVRIKRLRHRVEDRGLEYLLREVDVVRADRGPPLRVIGAAIKEPAAAPVVAAERDDGPATGGAAEQPAQEVGGIRVQARGPRQGASLSYPLVGSPPPCQLGMGRLPQVVRDDLVRGERNPQQFMLGPSALRFGAPAVDLLRLIPEELTAVEGPVDDLPDGRGRPALARGPRRGDVFRIESLGDAGEAEPRRAEREDPLDYRRLRGVDRSSDIQALARAGGSGGLREHRDVVVAVDPAPRDVAGLGLPAQRIVGALARLLAFHLRGEVRRGEEELAERRVESGFLVLEVAEEPDARVDDLLDGPSCLDLLAAQAGLLAHDEALEGRPRAEGIHQAEETGALDEFGPGDAVVHVDVRVEHGPALADGVGLGVLNLAGDGLVVLRYAGLLGRFPGVDGGDHGVAPLRPARSSAARASRTSSKTADDQNGEGRGGPGHQSCHAGSQGSA